MPEPRDFDGFRVETMNGADRALMDILGSVRRPDGYCMWTIDFSHAAKFRSERIAQTGVPISFNDMTLRAIALSLGQDETMRTLISGYRRYRSNSVDIGCLVAADTTVAPIVVFQDADKLSLEEIYTQRVKMVKQAREDEDRRLAELEKMTRFLPDGIRRRLVTRFINDPRNRRKLSGTIQLSVIELDDMEWMCPAHIGGAIVISMGGIKERPMVIDGQVVARLCALVTFMHDQRIVHPVKIMRVLRRFKRLIENPQKLA